MHKPHTLAIALIWLSILPVATAQADDAAAGTDSEAETGFLDALLDQPAPQNTDEAPPATDAAATDGGGVEPYEQTIPIAADPGAPEQIKAPPRTTQLEEIIVTATKREASSRDVPITIDAMMGEDLEKMGAREVKDFITQVPGITLQDSSSGEAGGRSITVRGVGPGNASGGSGNSGNQTVGQFIGDIPMTDPYSNFVTPDLDPFDLRSVEILKGPQGTTFGASALNGAIRYVPQGPIMAQWSARSFGDYQSVTDGAADFSFGAGVNVPVGDRLAVRVIGVQQHAPGVYDNLRRNTPDADSRDKWSARGMLRWEPVDRLSIDLLYQKQSAHQDAVLSADNGEGRLETNKQPGPSSIDTGFDLASLDARYEFDTLGTLVMQASYQHKSAVIDLDPGATGQAGLESIRAYADYKTKGYSYEARLVSPGDGKWNWIAGIFTMKYDAFAFAELYLVNGEDLAFLPDPLGLLITPRGPVPARTQVVPEAAETSFYGELSRVLGERWELTLGARHYDTSFEGEREIRTLAIANTAQIDQGEKGVSPKLSLAYRPNDDVMAYFTIARGFQFGGANAPPILSLPFNNPVTGLPVPVEFDSSDLWSRELGIRTSWMENTLQADLTLFDLDWSNAQFGQSTGGAISSLYIDNVGKVRSQGAEASLAYLTPIDGLVLNIAASYTDARTATAYDAGDGNVVPAGTQMPASPKVQTASTLVYSPMLGPWATSVSLNHVYWGPAFNNIQHEARIYDFQTWSVLLSVARPDWAGRPSITIGLSNLTDERALLSYSDLGAAAGGPAWVYMRPRAFSIRLSAEFE
jgi:iron complex outermembrane receptor protein